MKQLVLSNFSYPLLTSMALCLFFGLFLAAFIWVFRRKSSGFYGEIAQYPLHDEDSSL